MATVPIPISRRVRMTRTAISPRLAINTLRNIEPIVARVPQPVTVRHTGDAEPHRNHARNSRVDCARAELTALLELGESSVMALESIEGSLKQRGVRLTRQRQILLDLIDKTGEHLDAESLFQLA